MILGMPIKEGYNCGSLNNTRIASDSERPKKPFEMDFVEHSTRKYFKTFQIFAKSPKSIAKVFTINEFNGRYFESQQMGKST